MMRDDHYWDLRFLVSNVGCCPRHSTVPCVTRMVEEHVAMLGPLREVRVTVVFDDDFAPGISVTGNVRIKVKPRTMAIFPEVCISRSLSVSLYKPTNDRTLPQLES